MLSHQSIQLYYVDTLPSEQRLANVETILAPLSVNLQPQKITSKVTQKWLRAVDDNSVLIDEVGDVFVIAAGMKVSPNWQSLQILPPVYADRLERVADWMELNLEKPEDPFHGFKDYEVQRMRRDIDWMKEGRNLDTNYVKLQRADFYRFFNEHDKRRGTGFIRTFPEMYDFWKECEYYAKT